MTDAGVVEAFGFSGGRWSSTAEFQQGSGGTSPWTVALPGVPQAGDRLGAALLIAQLNAPFTGDVPAGPQWTYVIGAPGDMVAGRDNAGSVSLFYTQTAAREQVTQDSPNVPGVAEVGDAFGASLAVHETRSWRNEQTRTLPRQLAVGAPGEDVGTTADAGSVTLFRSEVAGLRPRTMFTQDSPGFGGTPEPGDRFGQSVAMRSEPGSSDAVLLIGAPTEDVGAVADAGLVQAVSVTPTTIEALRTYSEASSSTAGSVGQGHQFGLAVAAMQGRSETLWAITSPYQGTGSIFLSNQSGQERSWVPGRGGIPLTSAAGRFGWALAGLESGG